MKSHRPPGAGNKKFKTQHFGLHLTLDGYFANPKKLDDLALITRALTELPARMNMKRLIPPYVVRVGANATKDPGGYSGFVIIQESHISIHTFPKRRFVSIDLYSCKKFRPVPAIVYFKRVFDIKKVETNVIVRGKEYSVSDF